MEDILDRLPSAPHTVVLFSALFYQDARALFLPKIRWPSSPRSNAPSTERMTTTSDWASSGLLYDMEAVGAAGGRTARRILAGKRPPASRSTISPHHERSTPGNSGGGHQRIAPATGAS